ncbi:MAG: DPP IV N-terminal domain-containing protein [Bacteroidota bacterium]|nr:DPP IV N-terminal domain-containing protein [Bacteroidota bacterium]
MREVKSFLIVLFLAGAALAPKGDLHAGVPEKKLTLQDIFASSKFRGKSLAEIHWMHDGKRFSYLDYDSVSKSRSMWIYSVKTKSRSVFLKGSDLKKGGDSSEFSMRNYIWSPNEDKILFTGIVPARTLESGGNFSMYDLATKKFSQLTNSSEEQKNIAFSPDGTMIGFVRANNLFVMDLATKKETQLTFDGAEHIINGQFDWVYQEEFAIISGWRWSPDSKRIAFWRLDENRVPEYTITEWDSLHLKLIHQRYPKAGDPNSIVKIGIADVAAGKVVWADVEHGAKGGSGNDDDIYIPRIQWTQDNNMLAIEKLNRAQNKLDLLFADASTGSTKLILTENADKWIDIRDDLTFLKNNQFIWSSERDGYLHFYLYDKNGKLVNQITKGQWQIDGYYGVDERSKTLYYSSTETSPLERQIFRIRLDGTHKEQLTQIDGVHTATFSADHKFFLDHYSNLTTPPCIVLRNDDGKEIDKVVSGEIPALKEYALPATKLISFTTSDGVSLNASITVPEDFDSTKKYPVLFYVYGGPGSQLVTDSWNRDMMWNTYLTEHGYILFTVDNRGTGARGRDFEQVVFHHLGKWEVHDQIEGAKYLAALPYVDKGRIGIWGWSYGGYMASMVILHGADYFKTAVAVAPVTHWKFYDTIYTERYMGTPEENPEGYEESAPLNDAAELKGNFLLIHGTSDDNVHFQNSADFVTALHNANKQFSFMIYPDKNHSIFGGNTRWNLFTLITNFILEKL